MDRRALIALAVYALLMISLATPLYEPLESGRDDLWLLLLFYGGAQVALGAAVRRSWVLVVPVVVAVAGFLIGGAEADVLIHELGRRPHDVVTEQLKDLEGPECPAALQDRIRAALDGRASPECQRCCWREARLGLDFQLGGRAVAVLPSRALLARLRGSAVARRTAWAVEPGL